MNIAFPGTLTASTVARPNSLASSGAMLSNESKPDKLRHFECAVIFIGRRTSR
jgi:hypothetical protein